MAEPDREEPKSFGNMSDAHWSRARAGTNEEALEYYRERSHAPGVEEGGGPRNFYCMHCDGVIPSDPPPERCPHCQAEISGVARRYFNWVELDQPVKSDFRSLLPWAVAGLAVLALIAFVVVRLLA
ncbi:MAG: hypothetical protein ACKVXR_07205 [Planctomycetota bacterium]